MMKTPKTMNNAPKRARTPKMMRTAILAALAMAATACNNELPDASGNNTPDTPNGKTTIHVSAGQKADTRVAYEDGAEGADGKLTWQTGDRLTVVRMNEGAFVESKNDYEYKGTDGATSGNFEGTEITAAGDSWTVYYPNTVTVEDTDGSATLPMTGQTQIADNNTDHLRNYMLLAATDIADINSSFTLEMKSSIMKFALSGVSTEVGKLKKLTWMVETESGIKSQTLKFAQDAVNFGSNGGTLTAFLSFMPQDMVVKAGGKFTVVLTGDKTYQASTTISEGKTYDPGKRYTATISTWTETAMMAFTVKVKEENNGLGFRMPLAAETSPAALTIDWGDGTVSTVESGTTPNDETLTHTYTAAGTYTITITSDQTDATKQQIPKFGFGSSIVGGDMGLAGQNAEKLIRIDTPLLNTEATSFQNCFSGCSNLTSIPKGLFDNNTKATNFQDCFLGCSALTSIPQGLFDNNKEATDFQGCFRNCTALTSIPQGLFDNNTEAKTFQSCFLICPALISIPQGLFDKNTEATDFQGCFHSCYTLASIPEGLFDKNEVATNFRQCFSGCKKLVLNEKIFSTGPDPKNRFSGLTMDFNHCFSNVGTGLEDGTGGGTAPNLWEYNTGGATWNTGNCFKGAAKLTNWDDIPTAWGGPKATQTLPTVPPGDDIEIK